MKKILLVIVFVASILTHQLFTGTAAAEQVSREQQQTLSETLASDITCATSVKTTAYVLSTFPSDTLLQALFRSIYPALKGVTLTVMGKNQNTASGVYTWHMYYYDGTGVLRHCDVDLTMTKNTVAKYPYYWLYTLYIPTTTGIVTCDGILEQKYQ